MSWIIYRYEYGIPLNQREFLIDTNGKIKLFPTYEKARIFLLQHDFEDEDIDECIYIEKYEKIKHK